MVPVEALLSCQHVLALHGFPPVNRSGHICAEMRWCNLPLWLPGCPRGRTRSASGCVHCMPLQHTPREYTVEGPSTNAGDSVRENAHHAGAGKCGREAPLWLSFGSCRLRHGIGHVIMHAWPSRPWPQGALPPLHPWCTWELALLRVARCGRGCAGPGRRRQRQAAAAGNSGVHAGPRRGRRMPRPRPLARTQRRQSRGPGRRRHRWGCRPARQRGCHARLGRCGGWRWCPDRCSDQMAPSSCRRHAWH